MRILVFLSLALCALPALAQPPADANIFPVPAGARVQPPAKNVNSQIKRDLEDFVRRLGWDALASNGGYGRVFGSFSSSPQSNIWARQTRLALNGATVQIQEVRALMEQSDGKTLPVLIRYNFKFPSSVPAQNRSTWERPRQERVRVKPTSPRNDPDVAQDWRGDAGDQDLQNSWWEIVPPGSAPAELKQNFFVSDEDVSFWNNAAYHLAPKENSVTKRALAERSTDKLWQLGVASQWFAQEHGGRYALAPNFINSLMPYAQNPLIFKLPDSTEFYTFNGNLLDKNMDQIKAPTRTVLFYEGQNEMPIFRYDGRAAICFADGHVALVSPDEAKSLIWKP